MILQALYELAQAEGLTDDPDYEPKPIPWLIHVGKNGEFLGITGTHITPPAVGKKKPKTVPKSFRVPKEPPGRSGTKVPPCFFWGNAKYVFGMPTADKTFPTEEGAEKSGWFLDTVQKCAQKTEDEAALSVVEFLRSVHAGQASVCLPDGCKSSDLFAFLYDRDIDKLVTDRPAVEHYWRACRLDAGNNDKTGDCMVTGSCLPRARLFPLIAGVPGVKGARVGLVGFNQPSYWSYGWKNNENASISQQAAEACATALNRLLNPAYPDPLNPGQSLPRRSITISGDTAVCYWSSEPANDLASMIDPLFQGDPERVADMYRSIWRGKPPERIDSSGFFVLTLTGAQHRAVVRDWIETTADKVARNLAMHFRDLSIVRNTPPPKKSALPPQIPLGVLIESLAPPAKNRRDEVPAALATQIVDAAFKGTLYPFSALQRALLRYCAEIGNEQDDNDGWKTKQWNDARASIIKAVLNRRHRKLTQSGSTWKEITIEMDPNNNSEGYALGRLLAVLERIQQQALDDVNATVVDRYFSGSCAAPKSVFVRLLKNSKHHVSKAKDSPEKRGNVFLLDRVVDELAYKFSPKQNGFPPALDLEQQGLFVIGYHHMRKWLWMNRDERKAWEQQYPDAPRAFVWSRPEAQAVATNN